ncbi:MAG: hypothetical protein K2X90_03195 [Candidatus Babeliaceae bacterium]|nr:hypothetical protein [Candidatus Babeliaceae bacterium]
MNNATINSTQLWIGAQNIVKAQAIAHVQKNYCHSLGCKTCSICKQIENEQFHAFMMLTTSKSSYSRADLDAIFAKIILVRGPQEPFFCVITQADKLSDSCANSLLKLLEEPPLGWHWLLLTDRPQELLHTIKSRCVVTEFKPTQQENCYSQIFTFLTAKKYGDILEFHQLLERTKISDYESRLLLDDIIKFWTRESLSNNKYLGITSYLQKCIGQSPMPGSSKIFWRNVYLNVSSLVN